MNYWYRVHWQTQRGPGITFYRGAETVRADDEETARETAQRSVWRRAFRDFPLSHIEIICIEPAYTKRSVSHE